MKQNGKSLPEILREQSSNPVFLDSFSAIQISSDGMKCMLNLPEGTRIPDLKTLLTMLSERGVNSGIDKHALVRLTRKGVEQSNTVIARGIPAKQGEAAEILLCYRQPEEWSTEQEESTSRPQYQYVKKNELLAVKLRATAGTAGCDVYGLPVEAISGDNIQFTPGKNVQQRFYPDKIEYSALCDGLIIPGENRVDIESLFIVDSDVNEETGAIEFPGNILIKGSVTEGASIACKGSLTIEGNVVGASVEAGGDLIVKGKVIRQSSLVSGGKIQIYQARKSSLSARESIEIVEAMVECHARARGQINVVTTTGYIAGGQLMTQSGVDTPVLGSPRIKETRVVVTQADTDSHDQTQQAIQRIDKELEQVSEQIRDLRRGNALDNDGQGVTWKLKALERELFKLNQQRREFERRRDAGVGRTTHTMRSPRIIVRRALYPVVKLQSDKTTFVLDHALNRVEIFPNHETGEWQVTSLDQGR